MRIFWIAVLCLGCFIPSASANEMAALQSQVQELTQLVRSLQSVVEKQGQEIVLLKQGDGVPAAQAGTADRYRSFLGPDQGRWNPDIGVIADVALSLDSPKADEEGADRISVRELEIVFGSAVDPYSRFDATLAISDFEEMELEEAYLTRFDLPLDLTARVGRFLPRIGKAIAVHRDSLDTVDEPLVIQRYFGHHGFNKTGADVTRRIELPWAMQHQLTIGVLEGGNGEEGTLFGDTRRHPTVYSHLQNFLDINDATGIELGISHLVGSRDDDENFEVNVLGLDGTVITRYADQRHVKLQGEAFLVNRAESFYELTDEDTQELSYQDLDDARHLWGGYVLADWRFHPQWATGLRLDSVQLIETDEDFVNPQTAERGLSGYLTFYQSEFARWRMQFSHVKLTDTHEDNQIFVQGTFTIGEHKH